MEISNLSSWFMEVPCMAGESFPIRLPPSCAFRLSGSFRLPRSRESRYHFFQRTVPPTIRISYPITRMSMLAPCSQKRAPHAPSLSNKPPHAADLVSLSSNAAVELSAQARRRDTRHPCGLATARGASAAAPYPTPLPFNSAPFIFLVLPIATSGLFLL